MKRQCGIVKDVKLPWTLPGQVFRDRTTRYLDTHNGCRRYPVHRSEERTPYLRQCPQTNGTYNGTRVLQHKRSHKNRSWLINGD